jgi:DNA-binding MarR family transcriptional regulator
MSIDKDIQQHTFRNEYQRASINIVYTYGWLVEKVKEFLSPVDITMQQFNILRILRGSHPAPLSTLQIRERMVDKMSDTSRIVDRLIAKGLVRKAVSGKDRRLVDVVITVKGRHLLKKLDLREHELDNILQNITEEEAAKLSKILDKIRGTIK